MKALLGEYQGTHALRSGSLRSDLSLEFADVKVPHTAFKRVVRDLEFEVAEIAIMTFLLAKAHAKPFTLLPAVVTARFQHHYLACRNDGKPLAPRDLEGRRVAIRAYSVTTAVWLRDMLAQDYGVDVGRIRWVAFEEAHVAEFKDPPNVERAQAGKQAAQMLIDGEVDAAILVDRPDDPRLRAFFADPAAEARAWHAKHGVIQINHMVAVKKGRETSAPELMRLLAESKRAAGLPKPGALDFMPLGADAVRAPLQAAIDCAFRQGIAQRRYGADELLLRF
jgi:4,5-dihydroxyphthalate decarboxylase